MSNTDGEDTQRIKAKQILTEAIGKDCVFSIDGKMWNVGNLNANTIVDSMLKYADQELASLREQLKQKGDSLEFFIDNTKLQAEMLKQQEETLKQQEDVIRELIPIAEHAVRSLIFKPEWEEKYANTIEKAKSLTTKDK